MFQMLKQNVARVQVKHLLNVNSLEIIWSSFIFLTLNKLLPVLVILIVLELVYYSFLQATRGNFIGRSTFKYIFAGKNEKKLLAETFLSYQKIIFLMDVFLILQLSRNVRLPRKWFSVENKGRKTATLQETQADQIF